MKERITNISQLKKGDKIWTIKGDEWQILEYVEMHPHNDSYALMMNMNKDCPKFYLKDLETYEWYRYDGTPACWRDIWNAEREYHLKEYNRLTKKINQELKEAIACKMEVLTIKDYLESEVGDGFTDDIGSSFDCPELKISDIQKSCDKVIVKCIYQSKPYTLYYKLSHFTGSMPFHLQLMKIE